MHKILTSLAALVLIAPVAAFAAEATGKVSQFDAQSQMLLLDNGFSCVLGGDIAADGLREGVDVAVTYEVAGDRNTCTQITIAQ